MSRTFLITGASKGIGLALAQRLASQGHHIVGLARQQAADFPGTLISVDLDDQAAAPCWPILPAALSLMAR